MALGSIQRDLVFFPGGRPIFLLFLLADAWEEFLGQTWFRRRFLYQVCVQPVRRAECENNLRHGDLVEVGEVPGCLISFCLPDKSIRRVKINQTLFKTFS